MSYIPTVTAIFLGTALLAFGQPVSSSRCDFDQDVATNAGDIQIIHNQALGSSRATNSLAGNAAIGSVDVQIEINAALGLGCAPDSVLPVPLPPDISTPIITSIPPAAAVVGKALQYHVVTSSSAPASLTYSLSAAPSTMTVGSTSGVLPSPPRAMREIAPSPS
jgi:hypothetical protein